MLKRLLSNLGRSNPWETLNEPRRHVEFFIPFFKIAFVLHLPSNFFPVSQSCPENILIVTHCMIHIFLSFPAFFRLTLIKSYEFMEENAYNIATIRAMLLVTGLFLSMTGHV
jgi:hypothetical protein